MALTGAGFGGPQFYRSSVAQVATQQSLSQRSRELSDAVVALHAPTITAAPVRDNTGARMATLCLVQPGDAANSNSSLGTALAAYSTVLAD